MNVFVGRNFVCSFDNSKWSEENGNVPFVDIGAEHVYEYYYQETLNEKGTQRRGLE